MGERTLRCDLVCIGGGLGGLAGATWAAHHGLDAVVLEKSKLLGGVAAYSAGHTWVPGNHLTFPDAGDAKSDIDEAERYMAYLSRDLVADTELRRRVLDEAPRIVRTMTDDLGVPLQVIEGYADFLYPDGPGTSGGGRNMEAALHGSTLGEWRTALRPGPHFPSGLTRVELIRMSGDHGTEAMRSLLAERRAEDHLTLGEGLAGGFLRSATASGATTYLEAGVQGLVVEGDGVAGVMAIIDGDRVRLEASRGVLIATGSYGAAPYAASYEALPELVEAGPPVTTGDHLDLVAPTGAAIVRAGRPFTVLGLHVPGHVHPGTDVPLHHQVFTSFGFPHSMIVNRDGERFGDESLHGQPQGLLNHDSLTGAFPNYPCWLVVDDRFRRRYPLGPFAAGDSWPEEWPHGDDVRSLAEEAGIRPGALASTVGRFNGHVALGDDPDFGRGRLPHMHQAYGDATYPNPNLGSIEAPPFWVLRLTLLGVGIYSMGLSVDRGARVLDRAGTAVPGLYATGNAVAYTEQPSYVGGYANTRNIIFAALAVEAMA